VQAAGLRRIQPLQRAGFRPRGVVDVHPLRAGRDTDGQDAAEVRHRLAERERRIGLAVGQGDAADVEVAGVEAEGVGAGAAAQAQAGAAAQPVVLEVDGEVEGEVLDRHLGGACEGVRVEVGRGLAGRRARRRRRAGPRGAGRRGLRRAAGCR